MNLLTFLGLASMLFVAAFTYYTAFVQAPTKGQSPRESIVEAWVNILIGFSINFIANILIIPMATHGGHMTAASNFWMGWVFTTISMLRQYSIRRWFNSYLQDFIKRLASSRLIAKIGGAA